MCGVVNWVWWRGRGGVVRFLNEWLRVQATGLCRFVRFLKDSVTRMMGGRVETRGE